MGRELNIILAGFGGQGVLFAGKIIASAGLIENRELSWLPSYGPEMRGGTANCSVCLSDEPIGSPLVCDPDVLIAMNQPSLDKYIDTVVKGGIAIVDSTMCPNIPSRDDIDIITLPATQMAQDAGIGGLANVILTGALFTATGFCADETLSAALERCIPPRKADMLEPNRRALALGKEYR